MNFYDYLNIKNTSSQTEIKRAYLNKLESIENSLEDKQTKKYKKQLASLAFNTIKNRESKKEYDNILVITNLINSDNTINRKALKKLKYTEEFDDGLNDIYNKNFSAQLEEREAIKAMNDNRFKSQYLAYDEMIDVKALLMNNVKFKLIPFGLLVIALYDFAITYPQYPVLRALTGFCLFIFLAFVGYTLAIALTNYSDWQSRHMNEIPPCEKKESHSLIDGNK